MKRKQTRYGLIIALLVTAGCSSAPMDTQMTEHRPDESLRNTYWKLVTLDHAPVVTHERLREAHFVLHQTDSRLAGSTGCNTLMGRYQVTNQRISFNRVATTEMACPASPMATEQAFLTALNEATAWRIQGATLVLSDENKKTLAIFRAVHLY